MANMRTTEDLIEDALRKAGEKTDGTSDYIADAVKYMNGHYRKILSGGNYLDVDLGDPFYWAKAKYPGVITVEVPYDTGTVTLTQGSTSGTFSSAPAASQAGKYLQINGIWEYYRIVTHTAASTSFTIDSPFNDSTVTSAYKALKLDYDLDAASILRLFAPFKCYRSQTSDADYEGKVVGLDIRSFEKKYPLFKITSGTPTEFAFLYETDGLVTVRFNKYVSVNTKIEYDYIPVPTDLTNDSSSIPIIPDGHRELLSMATAYSILLDKEDSKASHYLSATQSAMKALAAAFHREAMQVSRNRGRLIARGDDFGVRNWPVSGDLSS